jgi:hypothetical protein
MDSGGVIYIPNFIKIGSGAQNLLGDNIYTDAKGKMISLVYY